MDGVQVAVPFAGGGTSGKDALGEGPCWGIDRPCFHVMPRLGWMNDPNGPFYHEGRYHIFYQQVTSGTSWDFGIVWGHAVSADLVHWEHLPPALSPTPGSPDADGCFSGCCAVDHLTGLPTILYTGVRLRSNVAPGPMPPPEADLNLEFIESQCAAVAEVGDDKLISWRKLAHPFIPLPPAHIPLTGWRDPFIFEKGGPGKEWTMLIGSGIKGAGGAVMVYKSMALTAGWQYTGMLCIGDERETGCMWECPLLVKLSGASSTKQGQHARSSHPHSLTGTGQPLWMHWERDDMFPEDHSLEPKESPKVSCGALGGFSQEGCQYFFCVSPDAPTNPVLYWLGDYVGGRFLLEGAKGPYRLDLGNILYAPNIMEDVQGRCILWGWLQERPRIDTSSYTPDYAGCLGVPRVLTVQDGKLIQEPIPEIAQLRKDVCWHEMHVHIFPDQPNPLKYLGGGALDIEIELERGESVAAGLLLQSWLPDGAGTALILVNWDCGTLEVVQRPSGFGSFDLFGDSDRVGGAIDIKPGEPLELRILIDHSCIEVFCGGGEVLSTRVYRGIPPIGADAGIDFVAYGGFARLARVMAFEMNPIWKSDIQRPMDRDSDWISEDQYGKA